MASVSDEGLDRLRRIETRLTRFMESQGFDTKVQRPQWDPSGVIHAPTSAVALRDCLAVIPPEWPRDQAVTVLVKQDVLIYLYLPR